MSASKTEAALKSAAPEPILCWSYGKSLEARYSARAAPAGGVAGAVGSSMGSAILQRQLAKVRSAHAVPLPLNMVVAVSASRVFVFPGPVPHEGPVVTLERDQLEVVHTGRMWHRLDLVSPTSQGPRVYTVMAFGPGRGPRRFREIIGELGRSSARPPSASG